MAKARTAVTSAERRQSQEIAYKAFRLNLIAGNVNTLVRYAALVGVAFLLYMTVQSLAGKATIADIGIKILGDIRVSEAVAWLFGGGGVVLARKQSRLRKDDVERLTSRIQELEMKQDRKRTSSKLTKRGETDPGDKL